MTCCPTNPQQIEVVEFGHKNRTFTLFSGW